MASTPVVQMPAGGDLSPLSDPAPAFTSPMGILAVGIEHALSIVSAVNIPMCRRESFQSQSGLILAPCRPHAWQTKSGSRVIFWHQWLFDKEINDDIHIRVSEDS